MTPSLRHMAASLALITAHAGLAQTTPGIATPPARTVSSPDSPKPAAGPVVLATYGDKQVTRADYEASILRVPERDRFGFQMDQRRISGEIDTLLKIRSVAEEAKRRGLDKDPTFKVRVDQFAERLLTEIMMGRIEEEAAREFDQRRSTYVDRAREQYLVNKTQFLVPKEVKASHILIDTKKRSFDEALEKVRDLRRRALAGEAFDKLAEANSDDPSAKQNKGDLGFFGPGRMDPTFEAAAFALSKPMDISEPVKTPFGWHIIRLEEIKPGRQLTFEEAMPDLMEKLKAQYVGTKQRQVIGEIYDPAKVNWNEAQVTGLRKSVDPSVYRQFEKLK